MRTTASVQKVNDSLLMVLQHLAPRGPSARRGEPVPRGPRCHLSLCPRRLQSGMNLQICFVNDSGSDKDSDADDSKTETSLDTPLSPMVGPRTHPPVALEHGNHEAIHNGS